MNTAPGSAQAPRRDHEKAMRQRQEVNETLKSAHR